jgi:uncharacterized protein YukE
LAPTSKTSLDAAQIESGAALADDVADELRSRSKTTSTNMHARSAEFTGMTGSAFRMVLDEFLNDLNVILQKLEALSGATRNAANKLFDQDQQGGATVSRAASGGTGGGTVTTGLSG